MALDFIALVGTFASLTVAISLALWDSYRSAMPSPRPGSKNNLRS